MADSRPEGAWVPPEPVGAGPLAWQPHDLPIELLGVGDAETLSLADMPAGWRAVTAAPDEAAGANRVGRLTRRGRWGLRGRTG